MTAIQLKALTKLYKSIPAVNSLELSIEQGELFSLLGVNGAGKSTTIKMLSCLLRPSSGDAVILGDSILTAPEKVKAKINASLQETSVAPNLNDHVAILSDGKLAADGTPEELIKRTGMDNFEDAFVALCKSGGKNQ